MRFLDLGVLQMDIGDRRVSPGGRRPSAVLSALLVHLNHRVSVDLLLEAVWGDAVGPGSTGTLETHIWRLRRVMEPDRPRGRAASVLVNDSGGYRLVATTEQVDSARFERLALEVVDLLATGQPARALRAAEDALALWRGEPFDQVADQPWASGSIARLRELQAQLQERRLDATLAVGRPEQAVSDLEALLVQHPFRERLWWQRMLALHRCGRTEEALQAYRQAREVLLDEIGMEPGPELADLHRRILRQDPTLESPGPPSRPSPARPVEVHLPPSRRLFGRERQQRDVQDALAPGRLLTLSGAAGSGKTRLAVEVAHASADRFPDGVWFVDLSGVEEEDAVGATVAEALGVAVPPASTAAAVLAAYARDRQVLLVLDNCEQVVEPVAALCDLLLGPDRQVTLLATSREPIGHPDEEVHTLDPLPVREPLDPADPASQPAAALFLERARLRAGRLDAGEVAAVQQICRAVDGIPLAIELAAALTSTYTLPEIADQVERDPSQLSAVGRGQARHHQTLSSAINRSYRLLSPDEQALHRQLSVLPGEFSRDLAAALAEPGPAAAAVPTLLARLVHRSLLTVRHLDGRTARFAQLATVRAHAANTMTALGETERVERRRDEWTTDLARRRPRLGRPEEVAWYAEVTANLGTVRTTLQRRVLTQPDRLGLELVPQLVGYWYYAGLVDEGRRWAEAAVDRGTGDPAVDVPNRLALATQLLLQGLNDRARSQFDLALAGIDAELALQRNVAELLLGVASSFSLALDADAMRRALAVLDPLRHASSDPDLAVQYEAVACLADSMHASPDQTLTRALASYEQASAVGNLWASWLSCSSVNGVALARRDVAQGLVWSRRLIDLQTRLGARSVLEQLETFADFLALDQRYVPAVRAFSASHHQARRSGTDWPRHHLTSDLLDRARRALSTDAFDAAWAVGPTLSRAELTEAGEGTGEGE